MGARATKFKTKEVIKDWLLLLEMHLQWEAHLSQPRLKVKHVKRLVRKHRHLMVIMKEIAQRLAGVGYKVMKFHAILHMAMDMLLFGPPMEIDTGSNEEHHKDTKDAAQLTQKNRDQFNWQTSARLAEHQVIDLAVQELNGKAMWECLEECESDLDEEEDDDLLLDMSTIDDPEVTNLGPEAKNEDNNIEIEMGGTRMRVWRDVVTDQPCFAFGSKGKHADKTELEVCLVDFLLDLTNKIPGVPPGHSLPICTCHKHDGQIF